MGLKFFVDAAEGETKHFQVSGIDTETGEPVTEDHWIKLRTELSDREWSELEMGVADRVNAEGEIMLDFAGLSTRQLMTWVMEWSFYANGNPRNRVKPSAEYLGRLDRGQADQIREIIKVHIAERQAEREAERNPTSPSIETASEPGDSETIAATTPRAKRPARGGT